MNIKNQGMTLVSLLVALAINMFLIATLMHSFMVMLRNNVYTNAVSIASNNAIHIMEDLKNELRTGFSNISATVANANDSITNGKYDRYNLNNTGSSVTLYTLSSDPSKRFVLIELKIKIDEQTNNDKYFYSAVNEIENFLSF